MAAHIDAGHPNRVIPSNQRQDPDPTLGAQHRRTKRLPALALAVGAALRVVGAMTRFEVSEAISRARPAAPSSIVHATRSAVS